MGMSMGVIRAYRILQMLELRDHWPNSLQIKLIGTILACSCAMRGHLPIGATWTCPHGHAHGCNKGSWNLADTETQQPPGRCTQNQVRWNDFFCGCAVSCSFVHRRHMDMPTGIISALGTLHTPELSNHWAGSLQIKFRGTIELLACICATSCSFAHWGHMGIPTCHGCNKCSWNFVLWETLQIFSTSVASTICYQLRYSLFHRTFHYCGYCHCFRSHNNCNIFSKPWTIQRNEALNLCVYIV